MLAANARIIVQCFLERLPFDVLEDHTVWIARMRYGSASDVWIAPPRTMQTHYRGRRPEHRQRDQRAL